MCAEGKLCESESVFVCMCVECERLRRGKVVRSWKDKLCVKSAMSGGAPDPFD